MCTRCICVFFSQSKFNANKSRSYIYRGTDRSFQKTEVRMVKSRDFTRQNGNFWAWSLWHGTCEGCWIWCFMSLYWFFIGLRPCKLCPSTWWIWFGAKLQVRPSPRWFDPVWVAMKIIWQKFMLWYTSSIAILYTLENYLYNIEPKTKNHPIEKENHLPIFQFWGSKCEFSRVYPWISLDGDVAIWVYWVAPLTVPKN